MKKLICVVLALAMCLGLGASALADGGVELPDATEFLSTWLEDYGVTVELVEQVEQNGSFTMIGIENVQDMQTIFEETLGGLDLLFQMNDFQRISGEDQWPGAPVGEYLYAYTGSASVGTVPNSEGTKGNVYVALLNGGEVVDGLEVAIITGRGISMKSSGTDTAAADALASDADNILPDAWAFFHGEITHSDKRVTNGKSAAFGLATEDRQAVYEYMDLLQSGRFGLTLTETWEKDGPFSDKTVYYIFDYPGAGPDMEITNHLGDRGNVSGDLIVTLYDWPSNGWCGLGMMFSDALTVVDTGERCTDTELTDFYEGLAGHSAGPMGSGASEPDSSPSGESAPSASPAPTRRPNDDDIHVSERTKCSYCDGRGTRDCLTCDGKGYIEEYISVPNYSGSTLGPMSGWEHHDCPNIFCDNGQVDCWFCGGDGWLD